MKSSSKWLTKLLNQRKLDKRRQHILYAIAAFVLILTAVIMRIPAKTATPEQICGQEEHTHTDACYTTEQTLICGLEESEEHTHTDECYQTEQVLTCTKGEHIHSAACYEQDGKLSSKGNNLTVEVAYSAGVVHDGTILTTSLLQGSQAEDVKNKIDEELDIEGKTSSTVQAYTMYAYKDGVETQPDGLVDVNMFYQQAVEGDENTQWRFYHISDNQIAIDLTDEARSTITTNADNAVTNINFQAGAFSTYVLVGVKDKADEQVAEEEKETSAKENTEERKENTEATSENEAEEKTEKSTTEEAYPAQDFSKKANNGINVTVHAPEGAFPEETTMRVRAVKDKRLLNAAINAAQTQDAQAKAIDISFYNEDEKEIEPKLPISVTMQADVVAKTDDITVVHIDDKNKAEVVEQTSPQELQGDKKIASDEIIFESDAFSTYVIVYTVDFKFGEYEYNLKGGESMMLSELLDKLQIKKNEKAELLTVNDIKEVEFSNELLLDVKKQGEDWELDSLKAFTSEETLKLTLKSGEVVVIGVTDEVKQGDSLGNAKYYTDIKDLLTGISVTGNGVKKNPDGSYTVYRGDNYKITLDFTEHNGVVDGKNTKLQFSTDTNLTYQLPVGFSVEPQTGTGKIGNLVVKYTINANGLVTIIWPTKDELNADPDLKAAWNQFVASPDAEIKIDVSGTFKQGGSEISFKAGADGTVKVSDDHSLEINKVGSYNASKNQIDYTITVVSHGHNNNVKVTDHVDGTALDFKYTDNCVKKNTNKGSVYQDGNGFRYEVDSMSDGETITLSYSVGVKLDQLTKSSDGYVDYNQTNNKVTTTVDNQPGPGTEVDGKGLTNKIRYSDLSKSGVGQGTLSADGKKKVLDWKIVANSNANVSMKNQTITDIIDADSQNVMKYAGTGIKVIVRDKAGNQVGQPRVIPWNNLEYHSDSKWTYRVPGDDGNYSYEITYQTEVTLDNTEVLNVKNNAEDSFGDKKSASQEVEPVGGKLKAEKKATTIDLKNKKIDWEIIFEVPATGYNEDCVLTDYYPSKWINGKQYFDKFASVEVEGLQQGENYTTDTTDTTKLVMQFYKNSDKTQKGLQGTGERRKIKVTLKMDMDPEWVKLASETGYPDHSVHVNNVDIDYGNDHKLHASGTTAPQSSNVTKQNKGQQTNTVDGVKYPTYMYEIKIAGITDDSFSNDGKYIIVDTYDNEHFAWLKHESEWQQAHRNGDLFGGGIYDPYNGKEYEPNGQDAKVITEQDGKLVITLTKDMMPRDNNGNYYEKYVIPYYLTVKDEAALKDLKALAVNNSGKYTFENKITSDNFGEIVNEAEYKTDVLSKTQNDAAYNSKTGNWEVEYTLVLNPDAMQIGTENSLTLTDTSSNLSVDLSSIKSTPSLGVNWNRDSKNKMTFTIPNATRVEIKYTAKITGSGTVHYSNKAELAGQVKETSKDQNVDSHLEGSSSVYEMNIYKHEKGDSMAALQGIKFDLYMYNRVEQSDEEQEKTKDTIDPAQITESDWQKVDAGSSFETNSEGYIYLNATTLGEHDGTDHSKEHESLYPYRWYKLVEVGEPEVNGIKYKALEKPYYFWISKKANVDYEKGIFANGDLIEIENEPTEEDKDKVGFTIKKTWEGDTSILPEEIKIQLYQKADLYTDNSKATPCGEPIVLRKSDYTDESGKVSATWTTEIKDLKKGPAYFIQELPVPGYKATYEEENTIGYTRSGDINLTNEKQAITIRKEWYDENGQKIDNPEENTLNGIRVNLLKDNALYMSCELTKDNGWKVTVENLDFPATYTVQEEVVSGYEQKGDVVYKVSGKTVTALTESGEALISNQKVKPEEGKKSISVSKKWVDEKGNELSGNDIEDTYAKVQLVRYKKKQSGVQLHFYRIDYNNRVYKPVGNQEIVVKNSTDPIQVKLHLTDIYNPPQMCVLTELPDMSAWNGDIWNGFLRDYQNNQNIQKSIELSNLRQRDENSSNKGTDIVQFSLLPGVTDIYLVAMQNMERIDGISVDSQYLPTENAALEFDKVLEDKVLTLDKNNSWQGTFSNLESLETVDGSKYQYFYGIREIEASDGFNLETYSSGTSDLAAAGGASNSADEITVTNKQQPKTDITFQKTWADDVDQVKDKNNQLLLSNVQLEIELSRSKDGKQDENFNETVLVERGNDEKWQYTWKDLSAAYVYTVKENKVYYVSEKPLDSEDFFYGAIEEKTVDGKHYYDISTWFTASDDSGEHQIINTLKTTDFSFTKRWKNSSDDPIVWPKDNKIKVTLYGDFYYGNQVENHAKQWTYEIAPVIENDRVTDLSITSSDENAPVFQWDNSGIDNDSYKFITSNLAKAGTCEINGQKQYGIWNYYLEETEPSEGYFPMYYKVNNQGEKLLGAQEEKTSVKSGEIIINKPEAVYELPETGSAGVDKYLFSGLALISIIIFFSYWRKLYSERRRKI